MNRTFVVKVPPKTLYMLVAAVFLCGCGPFRQLKKEVSSLEEDARVVGNISNLPSPSENVHVVVWTVRGEDEVIIVDHTSPNSRGDFAFMLPASDEYFMGAVEDENRNDRYDTGERFWIYGDPSPIPVGIGGAAPRIQAELSRNAVVRSSIAQALQKARGGRKLVDLGTGQNISVAFGDVAVLDDPDFSADMGSKGFWEPVTFMKDAGIGVYFLEDYDPGRTPVLFVYGAGGSPQDWRYFFKTFDRKQFQPWFYSYPSGLRLDASARILNEIVDAMHRRYAFKRLDVIAHSMGGLMSRRFIQKSVVESGNYYIKNFITISTPWNGHRMAELGVKRAPEAIPSWHDVQSDSRFIRSLLSVPTPVPHHLIYGTKGKRSAFLPDENDGTVSVESMLDPRAKANAATVDAFEYDHVGILNAREVVSRVESLLLGR